MKRDARIDMSKGVLIILVIGIHASSGLLMKRNLHLDAMLDISVSDYFWIVLKQLINFAVPGFLFLSAYTLTQKYKRKSLNVTEFYRKRFVRLYIPFLLWQLVYTLMHGHISMLGILYNLIFLEGNFHFWFLWLIFISYLIFPALFTTAKKYPFSVIVCFAAVIYTPNVMSGYELPINSSAVNDIITDKILSPPKYLLYFYFGMFAAIRNINIFDSPKKRALILFTITAMFTLLIKMMLFLNNNLISNWLFVMSTNIAFNIAGIWLTTKCVAFLYPRFQSLSSFLSKMGISSYGIYLSHMAVLEVLRYFGNFFLSNSSTIYAVLTMAACIMFSYFIIYVHKDFKVKLITGF